MDDASYVLAELMPFLCCDSAGAPVASMQVVARVFLENPGVRFTVEELVAWCMLDRGVISPHLTRLTILGVLCEHRYGHLLHIPTALKNLQPAVEALAKCLSVQHDLPCDLPPV